jgi:hypothetical protein
MKKLEIEIINTSVNVSILKLIVMIYRILNIYIANTGKEITRVEIFEIWTRISIIGIIVLEFVFLKGYLSSNDLIEEQSPQKLGSFLSMMEKKLDYLLLYTKAKARDLNYLAKKGGNGNRTSKISAAKLVAKEHN